MLAGQFAPISPRRKAALVAQELIARQDFPVYEKDMEKKHHVSKAVGFKEFDVALKTAYIDDDYDPDKIGMINAAIKNGSGIEYAGYKFYEAIWLLPLIADPERALDEKMPSFIMEDPGQQIDAAERIRTSFLVVEAFRRHAQKKAAISQRCADKAENEAIVSGALSEDWLERMKARDSVLDGNNMSIEAEQHRHFAEGLDPIAQSLIAIMDALSITPPSLKDFGRQ